MSSKATTVRNIIIGALLFILGIVIGYRYITPGTLPFISNQLKNISQIGLRDTRKVENIAAPAELSDVDFSQFWEVWQILEQEYIDPSKLDRQEMVYGAIQGMTASLDDSYTMFLPPQEDKRAAEELAGAFYGVGIELGYIDGVLAIVAPLKGMPAEQAGAQAGDLILRVKDEAKGLDEETTDWSLSKAVEEIRGERGTFVELTLFRPEENTEPFTITIARDEIVIPSVEMEYVEHNGKRVAHIILSRFGDRTHDEWDEIVADITAQNNIDGVLLDMRNNPGGYFDESIYIASEFVNRGTIVTQQGRYNSQSFPVDGKGRLQNVPVVVLVNKGSASASEIVAGALRDLRDVQLVGETTFGKGTVQDRRHLSQGGGLHVTVAKWLLPDGNPIGKDGIEVDVPVEDDPQTEQDEVVLRAIETVQ